MNDNDRIRMLEVNDRQLTEQMAELVIGMQSVKSCLQTGESRMTNIETELKANSGTTIEVRDILSTAKGAFRFFGWMAILGKWILAVSGTLTAAYVAVYAATHGGKPPWP